MCSEDNTWEPEENLDCPDLIAEFMQKLKEKEEKKKEGKRKVPAEAPKDSEERGSKRKKDEVGWGWLRGGNKSEELPQPLLSACFWSCDRVLVCSPSSQGEKARGFGRGLQPERIIGATDSSGELMFLMKWWVLAAFVCFVVFFYSKQRV